jgi:hypothetical protein
LFGWSGSCGGALTIFGALIVAGAGVSLVVALRNLRWRRGRGILAGGQACGRGAGSGVTGPARRSFWGLARGSLGLEVRVRRAEGP